MLKSLPGMESVDAKLARAHEHLDALYREITEFVKGTKRNIIVKTDEDDTKAWLVYWTDEEHPPIHLSVVIGDCVFNMRSALDNLVCGLIRVKDPMCKCFRRKFPIYQVEAQWNGNWASDLKGVPADAIRIIKELQPYQRPAGSVDIDPLFILNTLSNRDKHRAANLTVGYSKHTRFRIHANNGQVYNATIGSRMIAGYPHSLDLPIPPKTMKGEVHVEAQGTDVVAFRDPDPWAERSACEVLVACLKYVEDRVVARFKPFFR